MKSSLKLQHLESKISELESQKKNLLKQLSAYIAELIFKLDLVHCDEETYPVGIRERIKTGILSEYQVNETTPTEEYFQKILSHLKSLAAHKPNIFAAMRRYVRKWASWLKSDVDN